MRTPRVLTLFAAALVATVARAQTPAPAADLGPKVGDLAPDFTLPASNKDGKLAQPIHLSALKGQVVVLAFFPRARTSG
ncbi:MAG: redoxin domain-containing protein [Gemmatimonadetes bacterium]|nr:redoxin domain-containing protein [Gemmatimonadota bacterium]